MSTVGMITNKSTLDCSGLMRSDGSGRQGLLTLSSTIEEPRRWLAMLKRRRLNHNQTATYGMLGSMARRLGLGFVVMADPDIALARPNTIFG